MFFFCVFALRNVVGNCSPPLKILWSFLSLPLQFVETADYLLFFSAILPARHGILCSYLIVPHYVCFRSSWLGKLLLWNAVKMPVWTHNQTRHHCRQCRHAACGSSEIRSSGKKSTNSHGIMFAGLWCWRGEENEWWVFKRERRKKKTLWVVHNERLLQSGISRSLIEKLSFCELQLPLFLKIVFVVYSQKLTPRSFVAVFSISDLKKNNIKYSTIRHC